MVDRARRDFDDKSGQKFYVAYTPRGQLKQKEMKFMKIFLVFVIQLV